ncbi:MAG: hypothetical protein SNJ74_00015 [Fimbriimonadaceae bacterium]
MMPDPMGRYLLRRSSRLERRSRLRVMTAGEILDLSIRIYQTMGLPILRLTALPTALCTASIAFVLFYLVPSLGYTSQPETIAGQVGETLLTLTMAVAVAGPLFLAGLSYSSGAIIHLVSDYILGNQPDMEGAMRTGRKTLARMFWLNVYELFVAWGGVLLSVGLLLVSGLLAATTPEESALPGVLASFSIVLIVLGFCWLPFVLGRHALGAPVVVLDGLPTLPAIRRSIALLRGDAVHPSGYGAIGQLFLVVGFVALALWLSGVTAMSLLQIDRVTAALGQIGPWGALVERAVSLLPWYIGVWLTVPIWCTTITILYYERRIRLEGYDIEALARDVWSSDRESRFEL